MTWDGTCRSGQPAVEARCRPRLSSVLTGSFVRVAIVVADGTSCSKRRGRCGFRFTWQALTDLSRNGYAGGGSCAWRQRPATPGHRPTTLWPRCGSLEDTAAMRTSAALDRVVAPGGQPPTAARPHMHAANIAGPSVLLAFLCLCRAFGCVPGLCKAFGASTSSASPGPWLGLEPIVDLPHMRSR